MYPNSANAHDSLADAHAAEKQNIQVIESYQLAVKLAKATNSQREKQYQNKLVELMVNLDNYSIFHC